MSRARPRPRPVQTTLVDLRWSQISFATAAQRKTEGWLAIAKKLRAAGLVFVDNVGREWREEWDAGAYVPPPPLPKGVELIKAA